MVGHSLRVLTAHLPVDDEGAHLPVVDEGASAFPGSLKLCSLIRYDLGQPGSEKVVRVC